jgi:hypothetical protein
MTSFSPQLGSNMANQKILARKYVVVPSILSLFCSASTLANPVTTVESVRSTAIAPEFVPHSTSEFEPVSRGQDLRLEPTAQLPEVRLNHAEFAATIRKAVLQYGAIRNGGGFEPEDLNLTASGTTNTILDTTYIDSDNIPDFAREAIAGVPSPQPEIADSSVDETEIESLREQLKIPEVPVMLIPSTLGPAASPGSSSGSPTAFGADFGSVFTGVSFQERTRFTDSSDGAISAGFGLGDATNALGLEVAVSVLDLSSRGGDDQAFDRGSFSFKLHRRLPNNFAVAVGYENAIVWGFTDAGSSFYGVGSKIFQLQDSPQKPFSSLTVSLGLGNGRFRTEDDFNNDKGTVNVFGSAGLRVLEPVSVIADWTGQDLTLGASIVPFRNLPIVITPAIADITGSAGDGSRFILGIGYSYSY